MGRNGVRVCDDCRWMVWSLEKKEEGKEREAKRLMPAEDWWVVTEFEFLLILVGGCVMLEVGGFKK